MNGQTARKKEVIRHVRSLGIRFINVLNGKRDITHYIERAKRYQAANMVSKSKEILEKGLSFYPNSIKINTQLANIYMGENNWGGAISAWKAIFKSTKKKRPKNNYLLYSKALRMEKRLDEAIKILAEGLKHYPGDKQMFMDMKDLLVQKGEWKKVVSILMEQLEAEKILPSVQEYIDLSTAYYHLEQHDRALFILKIALEEYPKDIQLLTYCVDIYIEQQEWKLAIGILEYLHEAYTGKDVLEQRIQLSMLYQITGDHKRASEIFHDILMNNRDEIENDPLGYRKIILHDTGASRIEFYKNLVQTNRLVLTFDSIYITWDKPSFAFKLLQSRGLDIVALRKKKANDYYQDLSQTEYVDAVRPLIAGYKDKVAYGYSLGAYAALYYAGNVDARILALSPRISIHPTFGRQSKITQHQFKHVHTFNENAKIAPVIVYDPKNKLDDNYVNNSVILSFPKAIIVDIPYAGHGMGPHLSKMGVLKDFVLGYIFEEKIPYYDRRKKAKSGIYLWNLGRACLNRDKLKWANQLSKRALELLPTDYDAVKLRVDVLKVFNQYDEAIEIMKAFIAQNSKSLKARLALIDLYIDIEDLIAADKKINQLKEEFGEKLSIVQKQKKINEARESFVKKPLQL